jgi:glycosyltransferase involved in cell wall biosynthesis
MRKVAFWFYAPINYTGGVNYIKNLLYAVSLVDRGTIQPYIFFAADVSEEIEREFAPYAIVVRSKLLQRGTFPWFLHRALYHVAGSMRGVTRLLRSHGIDLVSHVWFEYKRSPFPIVSWIPDFQYLHLPEFFPALDVSKETQWNQRLIEQSALVILSSRDALEDFKRIAPPGTEDRARVLRFVSQPRSSEAGRVVDREEAERKYRFRGRFFFLPNQFWVHKNHMIVLRAVNALKQRGIEALVLCTGNPRDYRLKGTSYFDGLKAFIDDNGLQNNVRLLGLIDYDDVLFLMKESIAVLNPSRFEGWSSSVEEARSIGKPVILSDIRVHREQDPPQARYFDPDDVDGLAHLLAERWAAPDDAQPARTEEMALAELHQRTLAYGREYLALIDELYGAAPAVRLAGAEARAS